MAIKKPLVIYNGKIEEVKRNDAIGFSGYSGGDLTGDSGYSGYSGKSGYSGYSGTSGYSGYSGIEGEPKKILINQNSHNFTKGTIIRDNGSSFEKAIASSINSAEVIGIVFEVIDVDNFYFITNGLIEGLSGLSRGTVYFLSTVVAGALSSSKPSGIGEVDKPLFIAISQTSGIFNNFRGLEIAETPDIDHTDLINLNSEFFYHLTQVEHEGLTRGNDTALHIHDSRYYTETELLSTLTPTGGDLINLYCIGSPLFCSLQDAFNQLNSAGWITNDEFEDNGDGTIDVPAGDGTIRTQPKFSNGELLIFHWDRVENISLVDEQVNYIYLDYNGGSPIITSSTTDISNGNTIFNLGLVFREGLELHIFQDGQTVNNFQKKVIECFNLDGNIQLKKGGNVTEAGIRYLQVTEATLRGGIRVFITDPIDTSVSDTFEYYYTDGLGGWQYLSSSATQLNNTQYDNAGTLTNLLPNRYRTDFIYLSNDGDLLVILGQNNDVSLIVAEAVEPPSSQPPHIAYFSTLIAQVIVREGDTNITEINNLSQTSFTPSGTIYHNDTASKQGGTTNEYYHLTQLEYSEYNYINWNTAYTHSQNNNQAHTDYLKNNEDDETTGLLGVSGLESSDTIILTSYTAKLNLSSPVVNKKLEIGYGNINFTRVAVPTAPTATLITEPGNIDNGNHRYVIEFVTDSGDDGETGNNQNYSNTITIADNTIAGKIEITNIPIGLEGNIVARKIYRTKSTGSIFYLYLLTIINDNITTSYIDNISDVNLGSDNIYRKENTTSGIIYINDFQSMLIGNYNTAFGDGVLKVNKGWENSAFGKDSMTSNTTGILNSAFGYLSLRANTIGDRNTAIGNQSMAFNTTGNRNTAIGDASLFRNVIGNENTAVGRASLYGVLTNSHYRNTAIGYSTGFSITTGNNNIFIGYQTGYSNTTGSNNIFIGYNINGSSPTISNELNIGDTIKGNITTGDIEIIGNLKLGAGAKTDGFIRTKSYEAQTTDNTQTTLISLTLEDENTYHIEAYVIGVKSDGSDRASYHIIGTFYRTGAGNATLQGTITNLHIVESYSPWDVTFTVNGNDIRVSVTGVDTTTIEWCGYLQYFNMSS